MNRKKAILKPIPVTEDDMQFLKEMLSSNKAPYMKNAAVRRIVGGYCSACGGIPTQKAYYDAHGATVIEKYCNDCVKQMKFRG